MIKNKTVLEVKIGERNYQFECNPDSPLGELYDALIQMKSYVVGLINEHQEKEQTKEV